MNVAARIQFLFPMCLERRLLGEKLVISIHNLEQRARPRAAPTGRQPHVGVLAETVLSGLYEPLI